MGRLIDVDEFLERVKKDREHEIYLHSWTADMVLERLDSWYAPAVEAIPKADYETRLKADIVAVLDKIRAEIEQLPTNTRINWDGCCPDIDYPEIEYVDVSKAGLLEIINKYKAESEVDNG